MNKKIYSILLPLLIIIFLSGCKEQGNSYISWRNTNGNIMININNAYLLLSSLEDSILFTGVHSAKIMADIYNINDSVSILSYGHCWSIDHPVPTLSNSLSVTNTVGEGNTVSAHDSAFKYISEMYDLQLDTPYFVRSFVIIKYPSGKVDTGYNQIVKKFRTKLPEDVWFHNNDFNGDARTEATSFVLNNKAYMTCGYDGLVLKNDFWRYDPVDDSWTQLSDFRGDARMSAVAFTVRDTAYVGTGITDKLNNVLTGDMWKWTEEGGMYNTWMRIDSLAPGMERANAIAFTLTVDNDIYGKEPRGYIGLGKTNFPREDLLYYNSRADTVGAYLGASWVSISPYLGGHRTEACVSVLNNRAIVGSGVDDDGNFKNDFYIFDPTLGSYGNWISINSCPADPRANAVSFSLFFTRPNTGNQYKYFYFGTGRGEADSLYNDWWAYDYNQGQWKQCSDVQDDNDIADAREGAIAFGLVRSHVEFGTLERGFVALGKSKTIHKRDVWEYLP